MLDTNATWCWQTKTHNPMIYLMLGYLRIFTNLRQRQHCIKFQILSRLRTPWQYYPAFWVFFERQSAVEDPVPKIANPVCKNAKKSSVNVSMLKAGHNTVSHHRLSLLFPKLRLSNFMISSLASAIFVQCPPWWKKKCAHNWALSPEPTTAVRRYPTTLS